MSTLLIITQEGCGACKTFKASQRGKESGIDMVTRLGNKYFSNVERYSIDKKFVDDNPHIRNLMMRVPSVIILRTDEWLSKKELTVHYLVPSNLLMNEIELEKYFMSIDKNQFSQKIREPEIREREERQVREIVKESFLLRNKISLYE